MKRFLIKFFGVLSLLLVANFAQANSNDVFNTMNCAKLKDNLVSVNSAKDTGNIQIKYIEALSCNNSILYKNLIVKMFYMMFGEFSLKSMDVVLTITGYALGEDFQFYDKAKAEMTNIEPFKPLIKIMEGLAFVCTMFLMVFFSIFYTYYLFNSAQDGSAFGKSTNIFWTTTRLSAAVFLCLPLDSFGNFTAIQVIVMIFATLGILLANVVWFIMPLFELLFSDDVSEIEEKNQFINKAQVSTLVDATLKMQICDIQARKGIYLYGLDVESMTKENIENTEFGKCVKNKENIGKSILSSNNLLSYIPSDLAATQSCSYDTDKDIKVNCGIIQLKTAEGTNMQFTESRLESLNKTARSLAYDIIGQYCMAEKYDADDKSEISYAKECAMILDSNSFKYKERYGKQVIDTYSTSKTKDAIITSINSFKDVIYEEIKAKSIEIVKNDISVEKITEKIAISLVKGWLSASSFILDLGSEYKQRETKFNSTFAAFSANSATEITGKNESAQGFIRSTLANEILNSIDEIKESSGDLASESNYVPEKRENESLLMEVLFPVIPYLKEFNGMRDMVSSRTEKENCSQNFDSCARSSINPLVGLMKLGNGLLEYSVAGVITTEFISFLFAKFGSDTDSQMLIFIANVNELLSLLFFLNMISGLMMVYFPGIIIFAFFVGNALGWFLVVCKKIVIAQLWLLMHITPTDKEGFAGKGAAGYKVLIDILLRPSFIVFGVFVSFIMLSVMVSILNVLFGMVLSTFVFFDSPSGIIEFVTNFILNIVYVVLLVIVIFRCAKAMYKVPNALSEWFEMNNSEDSSVWNDLTSRIQNFMFTDMKKIIYFSKM